MPYSQIKNAVNAIMVNSLMESMQFDPEQLESAKSVVTAEAAKVEAMKNDLKTEALKLKESWPSVAGYGFLWNKFLPLYNEIDALEKKLRDTALVLENLCIEYRKGISDVRETVDSLPVDAPPADISGTFEKRA